MREDCVAQNKSFTFETVLSTDRNLKLLEKAKEKGFFIRCIYVLTSNADINVSHVESRVENGGHSVPEDKIRSRYKKSLALIPELVKVCDVLHIYDNSIYPFRIFKKRKTEYFFWENDYWTKEKNIETSRFEIIVKTNSHAQTCFNIFCSVLPI